MFNVETSYQRKTAETLWSPSRSIGAYANLKLVHRLMLGRDGLIARAAE